MENTYWHQQKNTEPLFADIIWSRPEQRAAAGKLAIFGGNVHGFNGVSSAYDAANKARVGSIRVLLPDSLRKTLAKLWPECEFAPSNKSGGFSSRALDNWLELSTGWADATLICGDLGLNSETDILLEQFLEKESGYISLCGDSINLLIGTSQSVLDRSNILLAADSGQLQRLASAIRFPGAFKSTLTLLQAVEFLHRLTAAYSFAVVTIFESNIIIADDGQISTTKIPPTSINQPWPLIDLATACAVWQLQQPNKTFAALSSAAFMQVHPSYN
jgi:NAD(P)H-hydrate repair Nnr-like enzyme with NAD(P)H-hydrate dehydratase domain